MSTRRRRKKTPAHTNDDPHDRFTLSVRKGYRDWLRKVADERNLDVSKLARIAIEEWVKANRTVLGDDLLKEFEQLRRGHGAGRYSDLL